MRKEGRRVGRRNAGRKATVGRKEGGQTRVGRREGGKHARVGRSEGGKEDRLNSMHELSLVTTVAGKQKQLDDRSIAAPSRVSATSS